MLVYLKERWTDRFPLYVFILQTPTMGGAEPGLSQHPGTPSGLHAGGRAWRTPTAPAASSGIQQQEAGSGAGRRPRHSASGCHLTIALHVYPETGCSSLDLSLVTPDVAEAERLPSEGRFLVQTAIQLVVMQC